MIRCKECDEDNLLGTIFCRSCGAKLSIEDMKPEDVNKALGKNRGSKKLGKIIRNTMSLCVLLFVTGTLILVMLPPALPGEMSVNAAEASNKFNQIKNGDFPAGNPTRTFTWEEATAVAREKLRLRPEDREAVIKERIEQNKENPVLEPSDIWIEFVGDDRVRITVKQVIYNKIPIYNSVEGKLQISDGQLTLKPKKYGAGRIGAVPFEPLYEVIEDRVKAAKSNNSAEVDAFCKKVSAFAFQGDGTLALTGKDPNL